MLKMKASILSILQQMEESLQELKNAVANDKPKPKAKGKQEDPPLKVEDILLFTQPSKGTGREKNDEFNKRREQILVDTFQGKTSSFFSSPEYGIQWSTLDRKFQVALQELAKRCEIADYQKIELIKKGNRGNNHDFTIRYVLANEVKEIKGEFKFGGSSISNLPEYFNPSADKEFHDQFYARYFYRNFLPKIASLYSITTPLPTEDEYFKLVHKNTSKHPFFLALRKAEDDAKLDATSTLYNDKQKIVCQSITEYLTLVKDTTKLETITSEFQRSQDNKQFLLYENGEFHLDSLKPEELIASNVVEIKNGNKLIIQSADNHTRHEMLLRWKNHLGILFPAWQISICRTVSDV
jgi:hypothetical protein